MLPRRLARALSSTSVRALSTSACEIHVPQHLHSLNLLTLPMERGRCMIVGRPAYKYPIAVVPPPPEVAPLLSAIRACEVRPFRIISYVEESGKVFNCSFFNDEAHMRSWITWLSENALVDGSPYNECMRSAAADAGALPTPATLLFGSGTEVLTDTRFGEYQAGMAINFSRQVPLDAAQHAEMCDVFSSTEFEQRIALCMQEHHVSYFGRLAMLEDATAADAAGTPPALITALRYGSMDDAKRGTAVVRELMRPEVRRTRARALLLGAPARRLAPCAA